MNPYLDIHPEVQKAIDEKRPVVALESTIISHGMPYPKNVETALMVEAIIRENGAVPATIAILDGRLKVGLSREEIEVLGSSKDVTKVSRRDLPFIIAQKKHGATTVAATMIIANMANIKVFATGGIGGVHRGATESFDISADLEELAQTDVAVVCAGAKSILDLGLTLEVLETKGVGVIGYQSSELPAFYTSSSGYSVDYRLDTPKEIADAMHAKWTMKLKGGLLITNPIPKAYEMDSTLIHNAIEEALRQAEAQHIKGKESTPFLLAKVKELTGGDSLDSNIQLVYNNAKLASQIAVEFYK